MDYTSEIIGLKKRYEKRLIILAHYYQRDEVFALADVTGDSYQLALHASRSQADHIVFCGVRFMAESARILAGEGQHIYLPDFEAGCPLADMISRTEFKSAMETIHAMGGDDFIPILYINSTAAVKAAAALEGGIVCTSSNAALIVRSLFNEGKKIFFLPDRNLGLYTAKLLSLKEDEIALYRRQSGLSHPVSPRLKMIVWDGFCNVHVRFTLADVYRVKNHYPYARILVHPECEPNVVAAADYVGSTSGIIAEYEKSGDQDVLFIGTELNLVNRLASLRPAVQVFPLRASGCVNMNKITLKKLHETLYAIDSPPSAHEIFVDHDIRDQAFRCLAGMIERVEQARGQQ